LATVKALAKRKIGVVVLQFGKLDLSSSAGKLLLAMLAAVSEMEKDLLVERTTAGLERAKAEGKVLGRPASIPPKDRQQVIELRHGGMSISALSRHFKVSRQTISRVLDAAGSPVSADITPADAAPAKASKGTRKAAAKPESESTPKARHGARKAAKATGKPAAAGNTDESDMTRRTALEQKYGQRRLPV
jgi:transposase